jgi:RNA polymerase sigma factor (TIGR02999 family)
VGETAPTVTELLQRIAGGSKDAEAALFPIVYGELRRIARRLMRREAGNHTLQTTALVHEAYLRLARPELPNVKSRAHFFAIAATVMRRVLVDYARAKRAAKRVRADRLTFDEPCALSFDEPELVLVVDTALTRLSQRDQRQGRIVELRFFAGLTVEETAEVLQVSPRTVKREWQLARAWLYGELQPIGSSTDESTRK